MRLNKSAVLSTALLLGLAVGGTATASAAAPKPPKAYGVCANVKTGALRLLEPNRLRKSQHGHCKSGEKKILLPTRHAIPTVPTTADLLPAKFQVKLGGTIGVCVKGADAATGVPSYECTAPAIPTPTPTVTVTATPSPTGTS